MFSQNCSAIWQFSLYQPHLFMFNIQMMTHNLMLLWLRDYVLWWTLFHIILIKLILEAFHNKE